MIGGCVQRLIAFVGCATILGVSGALAWQFRDEIKAIYESHVEPRLRHGGDRSQGGAIAEVEPNPSAGRPSSRALRSAERKEARIGRPEGPAYVVLTADEMASLLRARLDEPARQALDSLQVSLADDRFAVEAQMKTEALGAILGPLVGFLAPREPVQAAGPARVLRAGVVGWRPDEFVVRTFPLPAVAIPRLVNQLAGGDDGSFHIAVPSTVGDVRVRPDGVTFYRWVR